MNNAVKQNSQLPIGVFDSGVGGLTVLRALQQRLPNEFFLYLGDTARLPYGTKSDETIIRYAIQASKFLIQRGIKLLVVACNTATTIALPSLQQNFADVPIIGVVEPGAKTACQVTRNGYIAVIATEATVKAEGYKIAIKKICPNARVLTKSCSLFVALAEEGWIDGPVTEAIAKQYLDPLINTKPDEKPDTLVLGCTHFPILIHTIKKVIGDQISIVDSAASTAEIVFNLLQEKALQASSKQQHSKNKFMVTDAPERFARIAKHFLGIELNAEDVELVDVEN
jgi:glutamate racemase